MADAGPYLRLYNITKASMPGDSIDINQYQVAVVGRLTLEQKEPAWFICSPNSKLEKIRKRYLLEFPLSSVRTEEVYLIQDGRPIMDREARAKDYDTYGEKLLVFELFALSEMPESMRSCILSKTIKAEPQDRSAQWMSLPSLAENLSVEGTQNRPGVDQTGTAAHQNSVIPQEECVTNELLDSATIKNFQNSVGCSTLESKETAVNDCILLLESVNEILLAQEDDLGLQVWEQRVRDLQKSFKKPKTVIGLLGQTGAGKSSLVNALLDEERIVPTSCMQACTAAPVQIAFNDVSDSPYRAEIEFFQPSEWKNELEIFLKDTEIVSGMATEKRSSGTASTVARVQAVHPFLRSANICADDIDKAMNDVKDLLGRTEEIESNNSEAFEESLQKFIFTKQKAKKKTCERTEDTEDEIDDEDDEKGGSEGECEDSAGEQDDDDSIEVVEELWPLVKIVRIYTMSPTLKTGAVLVDLPGMNDSNAARSNMARGFMGKCDSLWIFSAIKRAVSDKTAKKLLGASLNAQLVMDGSVDITTFVCTGTDEVRVSEFSSWPALKQLDQELQSYEKELRSLKSNVKTLESNIKAAMTAERKCCDKLASLEQRVMETRNLHVTPPKRTASPSGPDSAKKRKTSTVSFIFLADDDDDGDDIDSPMDDGSDNFKRGGSPKSPPSLESEIESLQLLKNKQQNLIEEKRNELQQNKAKCKALRETIADRRVHLTSKCIKERNRFCKKKIREDYADCIREFDEHRAQKADPDQFDPSIDARDYDLLRRNLPVFCTSSIAYQKLNDRYSSDRDIIGFGSINDTEIPAIKTHCIQLTIPQRRTTCQQFLVRFCDLVSSLMLWAQNCESLEHVVSEKSLRRKKSIMASLDQLRKVLEMAVKQAIDDLRSRLDAHIYRKFPAAIAKAVDKAAKISEDWESVRWNTYRATCVRSGVFKGKDWNQALVDPIMTKMAHDWNVTFATKTPRVLKDFSVCVEEGLELFQREVEEALNHASLQTSGDFLLIQGSNFRLALETLCSSTTAALNSSQKEISRSFWSLIQNEMREAYLACCAESGPGCFARMKKGMSKHVSEVQQSMFEKSCDQVMGRLRRMIDDTENTMLDQVQARWTALRGDYEEAIGSFNHQKDLPLRERRRDVARQVMGVLKRMDKVRLQPAEGNVCE